MANQIHEELEKSTSCHTRHVYRNIS